ncbi:MAG: hypothetical protein BA865_08860 [Desulfobacterales bacterium S5133MH4]|nr:MAG: hypothetical protein BA865_08860 [Desulfobacterales bacterium S5133MH4]
MAEGITNHSPDVEGFLMFGDLGSANSGLDGKYAAPGATFRRDAAIGFLAVDGKFEYHWNCRQHWRYKP